MKKIKEKMGRALLILKSDPRYLLNILCKKLIPLPKSPHRQEINGILFEFDFDFDPVIKYMYWGTYETHIIALIKKFLRPGDVFVDVGANIGYISAIALGVLGKSGQVHSFEPVPQYFNRLKKIAELNKEYDIVVNQCALSDRAGTAKIDISNCQNIGWNTMVPDFMHKDTAKETIEIETCTLDRYTKEKELKKIALIKIDTEGFEFPVLMGLKSYFEENAHRPVIICEIAPASYPLLGYSLKQLSEYMEKYGYRAFDAVNNDVEIDLSLLKSTTDILFINSEGGKYQ